MTPDFLDLAQRVGLPVAILLVILWGGAKGYWVFGWVYRMKERESDFWRELALKGTDLAEKTVEVVRDRRPGGSRRGD